MSAEKERARALPQRAEAKSAKSRSSLVAVGGDLGWKAGQESFAGFSEPSKLQTQRWLQTFNSETCEAVPFLKQHQASSSKTGQVGTDRVCVQSMVLTHPAYVHKPCDVQQPSEVGIQSGASQSPSSLMGLAATSLRGKPLDELRRG